MDSSVRDLLDGAYKQAQESVADLQRLVWKYASDIGPTRVADMMTDLEHAWEFIASIGCDTCQDVPYKLGTEIDGLVCHCDKHAEQVAAYQRDPFGGVTTYRSDE